MKKAVKRADQSAQQQQLRSGFFDLANLEIMTDLGRGAEHDRCRTIFFRRQADSPFDLLIFQAIA